MVRRRAAWMIHTGRTRKRCKVYGTVTLRGEPQPKERDQSVTRRGGVERKSCYAGAERGGIRRRGANGSCGVGGGGAVIEWFQSDSLICVRCPSSAAPGPCKDRGRSDAETLLLQYRVVECERARACVRACVGETRRSRERGERETRSYSVFFIRG